MPGLTDDAGQPATAAARLAPHFNPVKADARIRDVPASCTCQWQWAAPVSAWLLAIPDEECGWHDSLDEGDPE